MVLSQLITTCGQINTLCVTQGSWVIDWRHSILLKIFEYIGVGFYHSLINWSVAFSIKPGGGGGGVTWKGPEAYVYPRQNIIFGWHNKTESSKFIGCVGDSDNPHSTNCLPHKINYVLKPFFFSSYGRTAFISIHSMAYNVYYNQFMIGWWCDICILC